MGPVAGATAAAVGQPILNGVLAKLGGDAVMGAMGGGAKQAQPQQSPQNMMPDFMKGIFEQKEGDTLGNSVKQAAVGGLSQFGNYLGDQALGKKSNVGPYQQDPQMTALMMKINDPGNESAKRRKELTSDYYDYMGRIRRG